MKRIHFLEQSIDHSRREEPLPDEAEFDEMKEQLRTLQANNESFKDDVARLLTKLEEMEQENI